MKRTLARVLWLSAALSLGAAGCGKKDVAEDTEISASENQGPQGGDSLRQDEGEAGSADPIKTPTPKPAPQMKEEKSEEATAPREMAPGKDGTHARLANRRTRPQALRLGRSRDVRSVALGSGSLGAPAKVGGKGYAPVSRRRPVAPPQPPMDRDYEKPNGTEQYTDYGRNPMVDTSKDHLSTFAVDVDTASYAIARAKILQGNVPPRASVRVEEFVNYFGYNYDGPKDGKPFAVHMDAAPSPFTKGRHILRVGVQAKKLSLRERKPAHLVFLVDVSGSMRAPNKLSLAKRALRVLVNNLKDGDTVALVTYASGTRVVLNPTGLEKKADIFAAIENLRAGGGTAMGSGLDLAYKLAEKKLSKGSVSRVMVLSDGDANIGATSHSKLLRRISGKVKEGVTLSTVGFGMGNYKDTMMEQLANKGNGNYYYLDGISEAKKVFQNQLGGTLEVVAKDVKIQVDFDKDSVKRYRLVGYENRDIADRDFRNDKVDAGEIGAGHTVTAIYEVELKDKTKIGATVRIRAKKPRGMKATESAHRFDNANLVASFDGASQDFRFATAVMATAEILRKSEHASSWSHGKILRIAKAAAGDDPIRGEFVSLLGRVAPLRSKLAIAR